MSRHPHAGCAAAARFAARGLAVAGIAAMLAGCYTTRDVNVTGSVPTDYRERHPITIGEGTRTVELFVGPGRGGLTPAQRAEVLSFGHAWRREATGGVTIERPAGGPIERAANDSLREVLSILVSAGIPNHGIGIRTYRPPDPKLASIRLNYPQVAAHAGPCGLWPNDLGPTYNREHFQNRPYHNLGCANQRNLAAMVENKADLVQPRATAPAYTPKRTTDIDRWSRGEAPAQRYPQNTGSGISEVGGR